MFHPSQDTERSNKNRRAGGVSPLLEEPAGLRLPLATGVVRMFSESVRKRFYLNYSAKRRSENSPYRRFCRKT